MEPTRERINIKLNEFIDRFDRKDAIVLLEGKRKVPEKDREKLITLGRILASSTKKMTFRSGNAKGADQFFMEGVASVDSMRLQVVTPYTGHRQKANKAYKTISLDEIDLNQEPQIIYHSKLNRKYEKLIDQYVSCTMNRAASKAAYIIRDTVKVLGADRVGPSTFGIFYDDLDHPRSGGTGHTMDMCEHMNVPMIDQTVWFDWLR